MKLTAIVTETHRAGKFDIGAASDEYDDLMECCDSVIAVLSFDQLGEWTIAFNLLTADTEEFEDFSDGTVMQVFDIDDKLFTIVSDSAGEWAAEEFSEFCVSHGITHQGIVDSLDCTGVPVEDIYSGEYDDFPELLELLHKVYN
tara:strand:+ start:551 stop:982 length:432 start_codon:yes stop_codon:yes gene_type:complete